MSRDVFFDEEASWHSEPNSNEDSIAGSIEVDLGLQEECLISFQLSARQEELTQHNQMISEEESCVILPKKRLTCCDKGKLKMLQHSNYREWFWPQPISSYENVGTKNVKDSA